MCIPGFGKVSEAFAVNDGIVVFFPSVKVEVFVGYPLEG